MYSLLYVDDEPGLLELGKLFLEETGDFQVTTAPSVDAGLAILVGGHFDAVISDYQMSERDGLEFLIEVRKRHSDLPFLLFTGRGREDVVIEAINYGVDFYIQKGGNTRVQFAELSHKILQAIRRKEAEDQLFRSRQMLQLVLDTIPQRVFWKDKNSVFLGCNKPLAEDAGYSDPEDLVGKDDFSTTYRTTAELYRADDRLVMETGQPKLSYEEPQDKPDGRQAWLRTSKVPLRNKAGEIIGVLGTYEDITEQKRIEDALRESEERLRTFFDQMTEAAIITDEEGTIIEWNPAAEKQTGIPASRALGKTSWDIHEDLSPPEHKADGRHEGLRERILESIRNGKPAITGTYELELVRSDGSRAVASQKIFPIHTKNGFRFGSLVEDITARTLAERALRDSEQRFRDTAELLPQILFELDENYCFTFVNQYALRISGFSPSDVERGVSVLDVMPHKVHARVLEILSRIRTNEETVSYETHVVRKDGTIFPALVYCTGIYRKGRHCGYRGVAIDISDLKQTQDELQQSKDYFSAIFDTVNDAIFVHDPETGRIVDVNKTCTLMYGYSRDEFLSMDVGDFSAGASPYTQADAMAWLHRCMTEGPQLFRWHSRRKDGTLFMTEVNMRYARIGSEERIIVTERDISMRPSAVP